MSSAIEQQITSEPPAADSSNVEVSPIAAAPSIKKEVAESPFIDLSRSSQERSKLSSYLLIF